MSVIPFTPPKKSPADSRKRRKDYALDYIRMGIRIVVCSAGTDRPVFNDWRERATSDERVIEKWFKDYPDCNYAIVTGKHDANVPGGYDKAHLCAIIVKNDAGASCLSEICERAQINLDEMSFIVQGGVDGSNQIIGLAWFPLASRSEAMPGVDVLGNDELILGAGSYISGAEVDKLEDGELCPLGRIEDLFRLPGEEKQPAAYLDGIEIENAIRKGQEFIATAPRGLNEERHNTALGIANALKSMGLDYQATLQLLTQWNGKCEPPLSTDERIECVNIAFKWGEMPTLAQMESEAAFYAEQSEASRKHDNANVTPLEKLNRQFAFVMHGSDARILWERSDENGGRLIQLLKIEAFHQLFADVSIQLGSKVTTLSRAWMEWPGRRKYTRLVFLPGKFVPPDFYNTWQGFAISPRKGDWSKMKMHIQTVICGGDPASFYYLMGWLARMIQKPGERGEVAIVLRGGEGTGKGTLANWLRVIFGRHAVHISSAKHLTGNFNAHMRDAVFLFVDEAYWAGDRRNEGDLKRLITEPSLMIEAKGVDAVEQPNCLHVLMASNEDWVVPASADARRYCVLDVNDSRQRDFDYFAGIVAEMESGGPAAMLYDLMQYDLHKFEIRDIPKTAALADQKVASLRGAVRWLKDLLSDRGLSDSFTAEWGDADFRIRKDGAYRDYCERSRRLYGEHHPASSTAFWKAIRNVMTVNDYRDNDDARTRHVVFPPLSEARAAFERYLRAPVDWGDIEGGADAAPP